MNELFQENLTGPSSGTLRRQRLLRNTVSKPLHFNSLPRVLHVFCLVSVKLLFTFHADLSFCKCKSPHVPPLSAMLGSFSSVSIFLHGLSPCRGLALPLLQVSHLPKTNITISFIWSALFQLPLCCLCISVLCSLGFSFQDNALHRHLPLSFIFNLVLRRSTIYRSVIPGPLDQISLQVFVMWSQVIILFATIMGPWANLTH